MINMKIINDGEKIIIFLFNIDIDINDIDDVGKKIKNIFVKIMKRGNYDLFGYSKVNVYHNINYGVVLEVEKIYSSGSNYNLIDLKIIIYKNCLMYLEFEDDYGFELRTLMKYNNKYYLEINDKININKYIEFAKIKYKKFLNEID